MFVCCMLNECLMQEKKRCLVGNVNLEWNFSPLLFTRSAFSLFLLSQLVGFACQEALFRFGEPKGKKNQIRMVDPASKTFDLCLLLFQSITYLEIKLSPLIFFSSSPTTKGGVQNGSCSRNIYMLHTSFFTFDADLYAQSVLTNKISASELTRKLIKSPLLVGSLLVLLPPPDECAHFLVLLFSLSSLLVNLTQFFFAVFPPFFFST